MCASDGSSGSEENPDKQKWIRREFMPEDKMAELVKKYEGMFVSCDLPMALSLSISPSLRVSPSLCLSVSLPEQQRREWLTPTFIDVFCVVCYL